MYAMMRLTQIYGYLFLSWAWGISFWFLMKFALHEEALSNIFNSITLDSEVSFSNIFNIKLFIVAFRLRLMTLKVLMSVNQPEWVL